MGKIRSRGGRERKEEGSKSRREVDKRKGEIVREELKGKGEGLEE